MDHVKYALRTCFDTLKPKREMMYPKKRGRRGNSRSSERTRKGRATVDVKKYISRRYNSLISMLTVESQVRDICVLSQSMQNACHPGRSKRISASHSRCQIKRVANPKTHPVVLCNDRCQEQLSQIESDVKGKECIRVHVECICPLHCGIIVTGMSVRRL